MSAGYQTVTAARVQSAQMIPAHPLARPDGPSPTSSGPPSAPVADTPAVAPSVQFDRSAGHGEQLRPLVVKDPRAEHIDQQRDGVLLHLRGVRAGFVG